MFHHVAHARKVIVGYNYFSASALRLFPGILGSALEQVRSTIAQAEMHASRYVPLAWLALSSRFDRGGGHGRSTTSVRDL